MVVDAYHLVLLNQLIFLTHNAFKHPVHLLTDPVHALLLLRALGLISDSFLVATEYDNFVRGRAVGAHWTSFAVATEVLLKTCGQGVYYFVSLVAWAHSTLLRLVAVIVSNYGLQMIQVLAVNLISFSTASSKLG